MNLRRGKRSFKSTPEGGGKHRRHPSGVTKCYREPQSAVPNEGGRKRCNSIKDFQTMYAALDDVPAQSAFRTHCFDGVLLDRTDDGVGVREMGWAP